jgi:hypothetical protein
VRTKNRGKEALLRECERDRDGRRGRFLEGKGEKREKDVEVGRLEAAEGRDGGIENVGVQWMLFGVQDGELNVEGGHRLKGLLTPKLSLHFVSSLALPPRSLPTTTSAPTRTTSAED